MKRKREEFIPQPHRHPGPVLGCPHCIEEAKLRKIEEAKLNDHKRWCSFRRNKGPCDCYEH